MSDMDKGAFVAGGYSVEPGDGGSFVVIKGRYVDRMSGGPYPTVRGFTDWQDLMAWLHEEHRVNGQANGQVVGAGGAGEAGKGKA